MSIFRSISYFVLSMFYVPGEQKNNPSQPTVPKCSLNRVGVAPLCGGSWGCAALRGTCCGCGVTEFCGLDRANGSDSDFCGLDWANGSGSDWSVGLVPVSRTSMALCGREACMVKCSRCRTWCGCCCGYCGASMALCGRETCMVKCRRCCTWCGCCCGCCIASMALCGRETCMVKCSRCCTWCGRCCGCCCCGEVLGLRRFAGGPGVAPLCGGHVVVVAWLNFVVSIELTVVTLTFVVSIELPRRVASWCNPFGEYFGDHFGTMYTGFIQAMLCREARAGVRASHTPMILST